MADNPNSDPDKTITLTLSNVKQCAFKLDHNDPHTLNKEELAEFNDLSLHSKSENIFLDFPPTAKGEKFFINYCCFLPYQAANNAIRVFEESNHTEELSIIICIIFSLLMIFGIIAITI